MQFSLQQALREGWSGALKNIVYFIGAIVLIYGISLIPALVDIAVPYTQEDTVLAAVFFVLSVVAWLAQAVLTLGMMKLALNVVDSNRPQWSDLLSQRHKLIRFIGGSVLYGIIVFLGLLLLVIPGIYWGIKYSLFAYRIVDANDSVFEALQNSARLTHGVKWKLIGFGLLAAVINIIGLLLFLIGLLVSAPITYVAQAHIYRQLNNSLNKTLHV